MKKMIIVLAAGIISTAAVAQHVKDAPPPPQMKEIPPLPPPPPPPAPLAVGKNNKGYHIAVVSNNGENMIYLRKNGTVQKIKMAVWQAKPAYFENKYGMLPPPPPPPPANEEN